MSSCGTCPTKDNCQSDEKNCLIENNPFNEVQKVIGVMSGKGGVGKSTVSTLLAKALHKQGYKVGILDADITGPSIPRLLGVKSKTIENNELGWLPAKSDDGIAIMSLNLMMRDEEQPVIWRGPVISGAVKQFWKEVYWGRLDYLIIDMPPGTGDVALTVMQSIPINGMVVVTTPQDLVSMIVAKSINMIRTMNIPVIGLVENMSYLVCPKCGDKISIFGTDNLQDYAARHQVQMLAQLPMSREVASLAGSSDQADKAWHDADVLNTMEQAADKIKAFLEV